MVGKKAWASDEGWKKRAAKAWMREQNLPTVIYIDVVILGLAKIWEVILSCLLTNAFCSPRWLIKLSETSTNYKHIFADEPMMLTYDTISQSTFHSYI